MENILITCLMIICKEPKDAVIVVELVRQHIDELEARL